eukprot:TRINITY_DN10347_c0_g1_i2.p1 TRINITY_DN10347_c0_g1~~TRINITY_DN10347_c0_g1_i2.p1  ORF type:complete len:105 (+),score=28.36 TRINITY_DN10347_c0_g1_i2:254-568(+)
MGWANKKQLEIEEISFSGGKITDPLAQFWENQTFEKVDGTTSQYFKDFISTALDVTESDLCKLIRNLLKQFKIDRYKQWISKTMEFFETPPQPVQTTPTTQPEK